MTVVTKAARMIVAKRMVGYRAVSFSLDIL